MRERHSKQRQIAEAAFSKLGARPVDQAKQDLDLVTSERFAKTARLRELRMVTNRTKAR